MQQNLPCYVSTMSDGDCDILEEIIADKYNEFLGCYWFLKEYSNFITKMKYDTKVKDKLAIDIEIEKLNPEDIIRSLKEDSKGLKVKISKKKKMIHLIFYN